ncbi:hypothetical protein SeMB42_g01000 [Synchytrium endobioticum]|uniref:NTF2 domain-containing protein n=1 Tax=Synchytrium endobioticum TaxID=286115 RepID=A0A507DPI0_9FUNG|nr:hypothetical protein SeMB42_g01000 [Synchytrium endobioticum]
MSSLVRSSDVGLEVQVVLNDFLHGCVVSFDHPRVPSIHIVFAIREASVSHYQSPHRLLYTCDIASVVHTQMAATVPQTQVDINVCESKPDDSYAEAYRVGWLFVQEYYKLLNQQPNKLHCFYNKKSQFTFGTECDEIKPRHGQQEIHQRIQELDFKDCEVKLSNIDSQTSSGGVLLQVLGEMSNQGGPAHKFAQTFFLARQTNGYFVLNDIFRFLKEEVEAKYDDGGAVTYEGSNTGQEVDTIPSHHLHQQHHAQQLHHQPPPPAPVQHQLPQQTNHYADYNTASRVSPLPVASGVTLQQSQSPSRVSLTNHNTLGVSNMMVNVNAMGNMNSMVQPWSQPPAHWGPLGSTGSTNDNNNIHSSGSHHQSSSGVSNKTPSPPQPTVSTIPTASVALVSDMQQPPPLRDQPSPSPEPSTQSPISPTVASQSPGITTQATAAFSATIGGPSSAVPSPDQPSQQPSKPRVSVNGNPQQASATAPTPGPVASATATAETSTAAPVRPKPETPKPKTWATVASSTGSVPPLTVTSPTGKSPGGGVNGMQPTSPVLSTANQQKSPTRLQSRAENEQRRTSIGGQEDEALVSANAGKKFEQKTVVDEKNSIYVRNIIHAVTRDMVRDTFAKLGVITRIDVVPTKGIAFVEFSNAEPVKKAVDQNTFSVPLPDGSRHTIIAEKRKIFNIQGRNNGPRYANQDGGPVNAQRTGAQQRDGNLQAPAAQQRGVGASGNNTSNNKQQQNRVGNKQQPKAAKE